MQFFTSKQKFSKITNLIIQKHRQVLHLMTAEKHGNLTLPHITILLRRVMTYWQLCNKTILLIKRHTCCCNKYLSFDSRFYCFGNHLNSDNESDGSPNSKLCKLAAPFISNSGKQPSATKYTKKSVFLYFTYCCIFLNYSATFRYKQFKILYLIWI